MYSHTRIEVCVLTQIVANLKLDYFHYFHLCFVGSPPKDNFYDDYGNDADDDTDDDNDDDEDR